MALTMQSDSVFPQIEEISPFGDVILAVGTKHEEKRLLVSSICMKLASDVFRVMFGPNWREGQNLYTKNPPKVRIHDDANAMRTACCVIHHRNDLLPQHMFLGALSCLRLAVLADKYNLVDTLRCFSEGWFKHFNTLYLHTEENARLFTAAYLLKNSTMVEKFSMNLILHTAPSYLDLLSDKETTPYLPTKAIHLLEERRSKMLAEIFEFAVRCYKYSHRHDTFPLAMPHLINHNGPAKMTRVALIDFIIQIDEAQMVDGTMLKRTVVENSPQSTKVALKFGESFHIERKLLQHKHAICLSCLEGVGVDTPCKDTHSRPITKEDRAILPVS